MNVRDRRTALVSGGTPNLAGPAAVMFMSLQRFSPALVSMSDLYFATTGQIDPADARVLSKLGIRVIEVDASTLDQIGDVPWVYTIGLVAKLEIFTLAESYDQVIWFDSDQVNVTEIAPAFTQLVRPFGVIASHFSLIDQFWDLTKRPTCQADFSLLRETYRDTVDFSRDSISGGVIAVTRIEDPRRLRADAVDILSRFKNILRWPDQAVISLLAQCHDLGLEFLDARFLSYASDWPVDRLLEAEPDERPYFVHAAGTHKFWGGLHHGLWDTFYRRWIELGGLPFAESPSSSDRWWSPRRMQRLSRLVVADPVRFATMAWARFVHRTTRP